MLVDFPSDAATRDLAAPDVSKLPGAHVVGKTALASGDATLSGACVQAPSDRFVPGLESVLFERATALALRVEGITPTELVVAQVVLDPGSGLYTQRLEGKTTDQRVAVGHLLTFVGPDRDALLCTTICSEPLTTASPSCIPIVKSLRFEGHHAPPPTPGVLATTLFLVAEHPTPSILGFAGLVALTIFVVLWRRPRTG